jgi:hypothetical protein
MTHHNQTKELTTWFLRITPRSTFVNNNMSSENKCAIIKLLKEYVDCFTWNYREMSKNYSCNLVSIHQ